MNSRRKIRVTQFSTYDIKGGAAQATFRLHKQLIKLGVDSELVVMQKYSKDPTVKKFSNNFLGEIVSKATDYIDKFPLRFYKRNSGSNYFSPGWISLLSRSKVECINDADIIGLFWISAGFLSPKSIGKILQSNKPVVWRLSDMWPFTGGCHYSGGCNKFERNCGSCPQLDSSFGYDISRLLWKRKYRHWKNKSMTIVCPSKWIADCAERSSLFKDKRIEIIPTGIDTDKYRPINKAVARDFLRLEHKKKYILYGAMSAVNDNRKGFTKLKKALSCLRQKNKISNYHLLVFGSEKDKVNEFGFNTTYLGRLSDDETLSLVYSSADVMVVPSLEDNLPNTALEAISCGTPVVAFNIGGLPDIIDHEQNGYLAKPYSPEDLAAGIRWVLENEDRNKKLAIQARNKAQQKFALDKVASQYLKLYRSILD